MNKTSHLSTLLAASAAFLLCAAPLTNAQAQASSTDSGMTAESNQPVTDTWITTKVKGELATTDGVKSTDISVKTVDGVVTLTGRLYTRTDAELLGRLAARVPGVLSVECEVRWEIDDTTRKGRRALEQPVR